MTALWIILGIAAFFALILSFSLTAYVHITDHVDLSIGIFGYRRRILPMEEQEESPEEEEKQAEAKKAGKKARKKRKKNAELAKKAKELDEESPTERTMGKTVELILMMVKSILPGTTKLLSHLRITRLRLYMTVATDEADQTAITYGAVSAGIYNLLAILDQAFTLRVKSVDVVPDFVTGEAVYDISLRAKLRLGTILGAGIGIFFKIVGNTIKSRMGRSEYPSESIKPDQTKIDKAVRTS